MPTITNPTAMPTRVRPSPTRTAATRSGSIERSRRNRTAIAAVSRYSTTMVAPMIEKSRLPVPPSLLKWLNWPRAACPVMIATSITEAAAITQPLRCSAGAGSRPSIQARASP